MRTLFLGVCLMIPVGGPSGCGSKKVPVSSEEQSTDQESTPQATSSGEQTPSENTFTIRSASPDAEADPLVPPLNLGVGLSPTGYIDPGAELPDFSSDFRAGHHAHGKEVCASGCAASSHPTPKLSEKEFHRLMGTFALEPMNSSSSALEALLYYGRQTQAFINYKGTAPLDEERATFLRRELSRTHALISFRVVDEDGVVRTMMPPTRVPLDRRHVFDMEVNNLPHLVTSGTVKRVGVHHLWTRL